jgi:hypothetical protein
MADTKNTEVPLASEPAALVQEAPSQAAPVVVRETGSWFRPLVSALVVVAALVVGGIGGFAIATATLSGGRPAIEQGQFPGGPGQGGPQQGQQGQQGGTGQNGERPQPPSDRSTDTDTDTDTDTEG